MSSDKLIKIALFNSKGGCGKSMTSTALTQLFALQKIRVLVISTDDQNDCPKSLALTVDQITEIKTHKLSLLDLVQAQINKNYSVDLKEAIITLHDYISVIPSYNNESISSFLTTHPDINSVMSDILAGVEDLGYQVVIFDCGPTSSRLNTATLHYVDHIFVPVQMELKGIEGIEAMYNYIDRIRVPREKIKLFIPCMLDNRNSESREAYARIQAIFQGSDLLFNEPIMRRTALSQAAALVGHTIYDYCPEDAVPYAKLFQKVVRLIG